jgi:hypothetical protein
VLNQANVLLPAAMPPGLTLPLHLMQGGVVSKNGYGGDRVAAPAFQPSAPRKFSNEIPHAVEAPS